MQAGSLWEAARQSKISSHLMYKEGMHIMKVLSHLLVALILLVLAAPAMAAVEVEGAVYLNTSSMYLWRGFDLSDLQDRGEPTWGLVGMQERAGILGGECRIQSTSGSGTMIEVCLPEGRNGFFNPGPLEEENSDGKSIPKIETAAGR